MLDIAPQVGESRDDRLDLARRQDPGTAESAHVCDGSIEVVERHRRVDLDRPPEGGDLLIRVRAEPTAPQLHRQIMPGSVTVARDDVDDTTVDDRNAATPRRVPVHDSAARPVLDTPAVGPTLGPVP
jgi:hypothetical protein